MLILKISSFISLINRYIIFFRFCGHLFLSLQDPLAMTSLMHMVVDNYNELISNSKDPRIDSWLLMQSPIPICSIIILYLCFVLNWGPKLMAKRQPFHLKKLMIAYNAYNVMFSAWICLQPLKAKGIVGNLLTYACSATMSLDMRELFAQTAWWYFFSKVVELLDTVFFVLRKKQSQVTFLHVYHHTMMAFFSWIYLKFLPALSFFFIGAIIIFMYLFSDFYKKTYAKQRSIKKQEKAINEAKKVK
ncbi:james bond [Carabus blaptoides fortunei]